MWRSEVPPPDASRPAWCGDQASALTAAECARRRHSGAAPAPAPGSHTATVLSLPPLASWPLPCAHCARGGAVSACARARLLHAHKAPWPSAVTGRAMC